MTGLASAALLILAMGVGASDWEPRITAHYQQGLMEDVVRYRRERVGDIPYSTCYIAHPTLPIGTSVQVWGRNTGKILGCVVGDTSAPQDKARHIRTRLIEVDFNSARVLCGSTRLRNDECPALVREMR